MRRYRPTDEEIRALLAAGWTVDDDGWWYPPQPWVHCRGRTYREARREQDRRERRR